MTVAEGDAADGAGYRDPDDGPRADGKAGAVGVAFIVLALGLGAAAMVLLKRAGVVGGGGGEVPTAQDFKPKYAPVSAGVHV
jgi:hypothetical protein